MTTRRWGDMLLEHDIGAADPGAPPDPPYGVAAGQAATERPAAAASRWGDRPAEQALGAVLAAWISWRGGRKTRHDAAMIAVGDLLLEHGLTEVDDRTGLIRVSEAGEALLAPVRESQPDIASGSSILLLGQREPAENGVYTITGLTRLGAEPGSYACGYCEDGPHIEPLVPHIEEQAGGLVEVLFHPSCAAEVERTRETSAPIVAVVGSPVDLTAVTVRPPAPGGRP